jgi:glycosyltransferase involved in cell wall biosynthesis
VGAELESIPDHGLVLVDGLVAGGAEDPVVAAAARLRVVLLLHLPRGVGDPELRAAERALVQAAAGVVVPSEWAASWLRSTYALDAVHVVEPGADPAPLAPGTDTGHRLLTVGAVRHHKGHDVLLDALSGLSDLTWQCRCVGALDPEPAFVAGLRTRTRAGAGGVADRVHFTQALTGPDLDHAYASSDLLVLPSRVETYGMVVTEALARGLPVVASDVGGVPEALGNTRDGSVPGLLVPPGDVAALTAALRRWLGDPSLREQLRRTARARRPGVPGWDATARRLSEILTELATPVSAHSEARG